MADVPVLNPATDADAAPTKSRKWLIICLAAFAVLAGGGAAAAYLLLGNGNTNDGTPRAAAKEPVATPLYVALDPPFVVNFEGEQVRFLQITVQVMTREPAVVDLLKANDPVVRNDLLLLFANQKSEVVATREGKEKLRSDALATVRQVVSSAGGKGDRIEQVYFTSFVMQ